ncbi:MAG: hypothetical protein HYY18_14765 [Planctomycetes bacterium]|nr:hypothetical protein [Planctomycetota bacterium]
MRLAFIALVLAFTLPAAAEEDVERRLPPLLAALGADKWAERERAQQEILALGPAATPLLKRALESATDPEVKMRLRQILEDLGKPRWAPSVKAALQEAQKTGRPVLVIAGDGPLGEASSDAGAALRRITFGDPDLAGELNAAFVLAWWNGAPGASTDPAALDPARAPEGQRGSWDSIGFYFCTPRGSVRHFLPGWWTPKTIREELARAKRLLAAPDASEGLKLRASEAKAIEASAAKLAAEKPEEAQRPGSEVRLELDRLKRVIEGWRAGEEVVGEPVESYLANRLKDMKAGQRR